LTRLTGENVGRKLAIVLDKTVYSDPVIRERIPGGHVQISGRFSMDQAHDLAIVLRSGALPAPVTIEEERTVGPSLGRESIRQGEMSFVIGAGAVLIFMALYYSGAGLLADFGLTLNILLLICVMAALQATLTLPGIAGIVLTLGMSVDANVLVNERMREELRNGKSPREAVKLGYDRAWVGDPRFEYIDVRGWTDFVSVRHGTGERLRCHYSASECDRTVFLYRSNKSLVRL